MESVILSMDSLLTPPLDSVKSAHWQAAQIVAQQLLALIVTKVQITFFHLRVVNSALEDCSPMPLLTHVNHVDCPTV